MIESLYLEIFLESLSFVMLIAFIIPKARREMSLAGEDLGLIPFYLLLMWVITASYILSRLISRFIVFTAARYLEPMLIFFGVSILSFVYAQTNPAEFIKKMLKR